MSVRWLFLDMNAFFASVEQQEHPELRGKPVAVVPMRADSTCCIAASYEAKAFGIKTGTNVAEARRLCPHVRFVEAKHGPYRDYHARIIEVVEGCLPISKVLSVDEMVCRLWSNERDLSAAIRLGEHVKTQIKRQVGECLHCSVGLGLNPFLAKVAAELQKPNGLSVLDHDDLPHKLYRMRLTDFPGISKGMEARLAAAGVTTTEQMYGLTREQMRAVWGGIGGDQWWRLLRGHDVALPPPVRRSVGHSHVLAARTADARRGVGGAAASAGKGGGADAAPWLLGAGPVGPRARGRPADVGGEAVPDGLRGHVDADGCAPTNVRTSVPATVPGRASFCMTCCRRGA